MKKNQKLTYEKLSPKQKELIEKLRTVPAFKGFTLAELLCVLAIIGIVAAISVPSITRYVQLSQEKACDKSMDALEAEIKSLVGSRRFFNDEDLSNAVDKLVEKYSKTPLVDNDAPVEFVNESEGTVVEARVGEICPNDGTCEVEWRIKATADEYVKEFDFICDCDCHEDKEIDLKNIKVRIFEEIEISGEGDNKITENKIKMVTEDIVDDIELNHEVSSKVFGYTKNISGQIEWMSFDYQDEEGKEYCVIYRMTDADNNGKIDTSEKSISVMKADYDVKAEGTLGSTVYLKNAEENKYDTVLLKNLSDSEICWVQRDSDWYVESWEGYPYISADKTYVISTRDLDTLGIEAEKDKNGYSYKLTAGYSDGYKTELDMITKDDIKKTENNGTETWYLNNGYVVFESENDLQKYLDSNWTYPKNNYDSSKKTELENIIKNQDSILEKFESEDESERIDKIFFAYQETVKKVSSENSELVGTETVTKYCEIQRKFEDSVKIVYEDGEYKVTRPYYIGGGSLIEDKGILTYVPNVNAGSEVKYDSGNMLLDRYSESDGKDNCFTYSSKTGGKITEENALKELAEGKTDSVYSCCFTDSDSHEGRLTEDEALENILNGSLDAVQACLEEISVVCRADSAEILEKFETGTKNSEYIFIDPEDPEKILDYEEAKEKIDDGTELIVLEDKKIYSSTILSSQLKIKNEIDEETVSVWLNKGKDNPETEDHKEMYTVSGKRQLIITEGTSITLTGDPVESDFNPYDEEIGKGYYFSIDGDDRKLTEEKAYEILIESGISYNKAEVFYEENGKQYSAGIMTYEFSDNAELIGKDNGSKQYSVHAQFAVEGYNSAGVLVDSLPCGYFDVPEFDPSNTDWTGTDKKGGYYYFAKTPVSVERLSETEVKEIFMEEDNLLDGHLTEINAYYINFDSDEQSDPVFAGRLILEFADHADLLEDTNTSNDKDYCAKAYFTIKGYNKTDSEALDSTDRFSLFVPEYSRDDKKPTGYFFAENKNTISRYTEKEILAKFKDGSVSEINAYYKSEDVNANIAYAGKIVSEYSGSAVLDIVSDKYIVKAGFEPVGYNSKNKKLHKGELKYFAAAESTADNTKGYYFKADDSTKYSYADAAKMLTGFECDAITAYYSNGSGEPTTVTPSIKRFFKSTARVVRNSDGTFGVEGLFSLKADTLETSADWYSVPEYDSKTGRGFYFTVPSAPEKYLSSEEAYKLLESGKNAVLDVYYKDAENKDPVKAGTVKSVFTDSARVVKENDDKTAENYKVQGEFKLNAYDISGELTSEDKSPKYYDIPKWVEGGEAGYYYNTVGGAERLDEAKAFELINDGTEKKIDICVIAGNGCAQKEAGYIETAFTEKARLTVNTEDGKVTGYGAEGEYAVTVVSKAGTGTTVIDTLDARYIPGQFSTEKTGYYYSDSRTEKMNWTDALADLESLDVDKVTVVYYDSVSGKTAEAGTIELEYCENAKLVKGDDYKVEAEFCTVGKIGSEKIEGSDGEKKYIAVDPYDSKTGKGYYFGDEGDHLTEAAAKEKLYKFDQKNIDVYYSDNGKEDTKAGTLSRVYEGEAELVLENGHFAVDGDFHVSGKSVGSETSVDTESETVRVPEYNESKDEGYYFTAGGNDKLDEETALEKLKNFECDKVKVYYKDIDSSEATELETVITRKFTGNAKIVETPDGKYAVQGEFTLGFDDEQTSSSWLDVPAYKTDKSSDDDTGTGYYFTLKGETEKLNSEDVKELLESGKNVEIEAWYKDSTEKNSAVKAGTLKSIFTDNAKVVKDTDENTPENYKVQGEFKINVYDSDGELASEDTDPKYYDVPKWTEDGDAGYYYNTVGGSKRLNEEDAFKLINDGKEKTVDICVIAGEICGQQKVGQISADFTGNARLVFDESGSGDDYSFSYMAEGEYEVAVISGTGTAESVVENLGKKYLPAAYKTDDTGYYFETDGKKTSWRGAYDKLKNQSASETVAHFYDSESNSDVIAGTVKMEFAGDAELVKGNDFAVNALYYPAGHSIGSGEILGNVDETAQYLPAKIYSSTDHNGYYFGDHINEAAAEEKLNSFEADSFDVKYDDNASVTANAGTISRKYNGNASVGIEQNKFVIRGSFKTVGKDGSTVVSESNSQDLIIPQTGTKLSSAGSYYKTSESGEILTEAQMENSLKSFEARSAAAYYLDSDGTVYDVEPDIERIFTGKTKLIEKDDGSLTVQGQFMLQAGSVSTEPEYLNIPKYNSDTQTGYYFTNSSDDGTILTEEQAKALLDQNVTLNIWYKDGKNADKVKVGYISREFTGKAKTVEAPAGSDHRYEVAAEYQTVVFDSGNNKTISENDKKYENVPMWDESSGYGYYFADESGKKISEADTFDSLEINYGTTVKIEYVNQKDETPVLAGTVSSEFTGLVELVSRSAPSEPLEMAVNGNYAIVVRTKNSDTVEDRLGMSNAKDKQGVFSTSQTGYYFIDSKGEKAEWSKVFDELKEGTLTEAKGYYFDKASGRTEYAGSVQLTSYRYEITGTKDIGVAEKYTALIKTADPAGPEKPYNVCIDVKPYTEETGEGYYLLDNSTNKIIPGTLKEALEAVAAGTYSDVSVYYHAGKDALSVSTDKCIGKLLARNKYMTSENKLVKENDNYVVYNNMEVELGYQSGTSDFVLVEKVKRFEKQQPYNSASGTGYSFKVDPDDTKYTYAQTVELMKSGQLKSVKVKCNGKAEDGVTYSYGTGVMNVEQTGVTASYSGGTEKFDISKLDISALFNVAYSDSNYSKHNIASMFTFTKTLSHSENGSDGYTLSYNGKSDAETLKMLEAGNFDGNVTVSYGGKSASVYIKIEKTVDDSIMYGNDPEGFVYIINDIGEIEIAGYRGHSTDIVFPSEFRGGYWKEVALNYSNPNQVRIGGGWPPVCYEFVEQSPDTVYKVTTVGENYSSAFFGTTDGNNVLNNATSLIFSEGIERIGTGFLPNTKSWPNNLKKIVIPDSVKYIGDYAFSYTYNSDVELVLGTGLEYIGDYAFQNSRRMYGDIVLTDSLKYLGTGAFNNFNENLQDPSKAGSLVIEGGNYDEATGTCSIPAGCFSYAKFHNITIGGNVSRIEANAFKCDHNLLSGHLEIGDSVTYIGDNAFYGCKMLSGDLYIPPNVTYLGTGAFGSFSNNNMTGAGKLTVYGGTKNGSSVTINSGVFDSGSCFRDVEIGGAVTNIGDNAFQNMDFLYGSLQIGPSVTSIGANAFNRCTHLTGNLTIPETVKSIGQGAFYSYGMSESNDAAGKLTLYGGSSTISKGIFNSESRFKNVEIGGNISKIDSSAFENCTNISGDLTIDGGIAKIDGNAFKNCRFDGVLTIERENGKIFGIISYADITVENDAFVGNNFNLLRCSSKVKNKLKSRSNWYSSEKTGPFGNQDIPNNFEEI